MTLLAAQIDIDRSPPRAHVEYRGRWRVVLRCPETDEVRTEILFPTREAALEWIIEEMERARQQLERGV